MLYVVYIHIYTYIFEYVYCMCVMISPQSPVRLGKKMNHSINPHNAQTFFCHLAIQFCPNLPSRYDWKYKQRNDHYKEGWNDHWKHWNWRDQKDDRNDRKDVRKEERLLETNKTIGRNLMGSTGYTGNMGIQPPGNYKELQLDPENRSLVEIYLPTKTDRVQDVTWLGGNCL